MGEVVHLLGIQGRDPGLIYDTEGKKLPFKESRGFPSSHKIPWRRQDPIHKTRQAQTLLSFPLGPRGLMAQICFSSFPFFTASPSPHFLLPSLSAWLKCCVAHPALRDGESDTISTLVWSADLSKSCYKVQDAWQN